MILERTNSEILVRLPSNIDLSELQNMLDYLKYKELTSYTKTEQSECDSLVNEVNQSLWAKVKVKRAIK